MIEINIKSIKDSANVLIKFIDEEYMESTLNNGFFFNKLEIFKKNEQALTDEQMDTDEGCVVNFNKGDGIEVFDENFKKVTHLTPKEILKLKLIKSYNFAAKIPICCFVLLKFPYDFTFVKKHKNIFEYKIKESVQEKLEGIGNKRPYLYFSQQMMLKGLKEKIKTDGKILAAKIKYYKEFDKNITEDELNKKPFKIIFMKNEKYKNQKEFRIALIDKREACFFKPFELDDTKVSKDLNEFRLYINPKYSEGLFSMQLANKNDEIIYKV